MDEDLNNLPANAADAAPADRFRAAAERALREVAPQEYYLHTQPGTGGSDPLGGLSAEERACLSEALLAAAAAGGRSHEEILGEAGIDNLDPGDPSPLDLAALAQALQHDHPEALAAAAHRLQDRPALLFALLGKRVLMQMLNSPG
jgi:hypothetical protein